MLTVVAAAGATRPQSCATCHVKEAASQPVTPMGRALLTPGINHTLEAKPDLTYTRGKFTYRIETRDGKSTYRVTDGDRTLALSIEWTFGAGAQTYLLSREGAFIESMVSYYPETGGLDLTVGDQSLNPQTVEDALGRRLTPDVVMACFGCHSANSSAAHQLHLEALQPGVTCDRCHSGAQQHAASMTGPAAARRFPEKLGKRTTESISNWCGQCHRSWETVVRNNWRGPINVRFQPYRLAHSKCFDGTDPRISCVACHNPHQNLVKVADGAPSTYDAKCAACHGVTTKRCPVAQSGCVTCHMPKVQLPGGHQTFTDHFIRVVKSNAPYPD